MKTWIKGWYKLLSPRYQKLFNEYPVDFRPRYGHGKPPHPGLYDVINKERSAYAVRLGRFRGWKDGLQQIKAADEETDPTQPAWNNGFLPGLDIVALYGFLGLFKPKLYVEVGSGNSTKVARRAIRDFGLSTQVWSIDPVPRVKIDALADRTIQQPLESLSDLSLVEQLQPDDILFTDSSHRCFPNSDVTVCFLELLPRLKPGVIVHMHDIYLPYDYPQFMCNRFYSEQYLLACWLLAGQKLKPLLPCYFISEDEELSALIADIWDHPNLQGVERHGGSFWMVRD